MNVAETTPEKIRRRPARRPTTPPAESALDQQIADLERTFTDRWEW